MAIFTTSFAGQFAGDGRGYFNADLIDKFDLREHCNGYIF